MDDFASSLLRPAKGEAEKPFGCCFGHDFQTLHHPRHDLMLDGGVQILGDLADDQHVDHVEARFQAAQIFQRTHACVQLQRSPQDDVVVDERLGGVGHQFGFQGQAVAAHRIEHGGRQRLQPLRDRLVAGDVFFPGDGDAGGVENAFHRRHEVVSDFAALDQRDAQGHG